MSVFYRLFFAFICMSTVCYAQENTVLPFVSSYHEVNNYAYTDPLVNYQFRITAGHRWRNFTTVGDRNSREMHLQARAFLPRIDRTRMNSGRLFFTPRINIYRNSDETTDVYRVSGGSGLIMLLEKIENINENPLATTLLSIGFRANFQQWVLHPGEFRPWDSGDPIVADLEQKMVDHNWGAEASVHFQMSFREKREEKFELLTISGNFPFLRTLPRGEAFQFNNSRGSYVFSRRRASNITAQIGFIAVREYRRFQFGLRYLHEGIQNRASLQGEISGNVEYYQQLKNDKNWELNLGVGLQTNWNYHIQAGITRTPNDAMSYSGRLFYQGNFSVNPIETGSTTFLGVINFNSLAR